MLNIKQNSHLIIALFICLIGLFLRAYFFVINRSLWLDEAMLALNIVNRSFLDLLKPLDFNQASPIGFLLAQKAVISLLGISDYTLRIIPLIAGLVSVPMMYLVSKKFVGKESALFLLGMFALSPKLIYYSSELKQYSTDVLTTVGLLWITLKCLQDNSAPSILIVFGIVGCLATWISHPSLFVFVGIFLTIGLTFTIQRNKNRLFWLISIGVIWMINLLLVYFFNLQHLEQNNHLINYWSFAFAPLPPWNNLSWYYRALINMLRDPAELPINAMVIGLLFIGVSSFAFKKWQFALSLNFPFLLALIASAFKKYPFNGRLLLFLLPLLLLLLTEGVERVKEILLKINKFLAKFIYISLVMYFLYNPIMVAYKNVRSPPMGEHIKPVMAYISKNYLDTDLIYVYYGAVPAFEFYKSQYGLGRYIRGISARNEPTKYLEDIERLRGNRRVWFIFSHNCSWCIVNEQEFILEYLDKIGVKRDEFLSSGASVFLYDLKQIKH